MWLNGATQWEDHKIGNKHKKHSRRTLGRPLAAKKKLEVSLHPLLCDSVAAAVSNASFLEEDLDLCIHGALSGELYLMVHVSRGANVGQLYAAVQTALVTLGAWTPCACQGTWFASGWKCPHNAQSVSYTHLTLPTIYSV